MLLVALLSACDSPVERAKQEYARGIELVEAGDHVRAELLFRNALQAKPDYLPAHIAMVEIAERRGELRLADAHLRKIVEIEPRHVMARTRLASYALLAGRLEEARIHVDIAYAEAPDDPDVLAARGSTSFIEGDTLAAVADAERALKIDPGHVGAIAILATERFIAGDPQAAAAILDAALLERGTDRQLNALKLRLLSTQDAPEAYREQLERMIRIWPDDTVLRLQLVDWHIGRGEIAPAVATLRATVEQAPEEVRAGLRLAQLVLDTEGPGAARTEIAQIIELGGDAGTFEVVLARLDYLEHGPARAIERLRKLIDDATADTDVNIARAELARVLLADGRSDDAMLVLDDMLTDDERDIEALILRSVLRIKDGALDLAMLDLRAAQSEAPEDVEIVTLEAIAHERNGSIDLALDRLARAAELSGYQPIPSIRYARLLAASDRLETAEEVLTSALTENGGSNVELLLALGNVRLGMQNWRGVAEITTALRTTEEAQRLAASLAIASLVRQKRFDEAIAMFDDMPGADEGDWALVARAQIELAADRVPAALALLDSLLKDHPENIDAQVLKGIAAQRGGQIEVAESALRAAIDLDPFREPAWSRLVRLLIGAGRLPEAETAVRAALKRLPTSTLLGLQLGALLEMRGAFDGAIDLYGRLAITDRQSLYAANNLASLLAEHRSGDPAEMGRARQLANRLTGSDVPEFLDTLGWIRHLGGDHLSALKSLEPAAAAAPSNPWIRLHLGQTYAALDRIDEARTELDFVLKTAGGDGVIAQKARAALAVLAARPVPERTD